jgi:hypothetical protein
LGLPDYANKRDGAESRLNLVRLGSYSVKEDSDSIPDALEHVGEEPQVALKIKLN